MEQLKIVFWISEIRLIEIENNKRYYPRCYFHHLLSCLDDLKKVGFPSNDIIVYMTPANQVTRAGHVIDNSINGVHVKELQARDVDIRLRENIFPGFEYPYSNKLYVCEVDSPNVMFLDVDGCIHKDPRLLLEEDFDFAGKISPWNNSLNPDWKIPIWNESFEVLDLGDVIPCMTSACMIFKNWTHKKIRDTWFDFQLKHLKHEVPLPYGDGLFGSEQHTITWAVCKHCSRDKIKFLTGGEYAIGDDMGIPFIGHGCFNHIDDYRSEIASEIFWDIPDPIYLKSMLPAFTDIYNSRRNNIGKKESISGPGSDLYQTSMIRREIPNIIKEVGAKIMLDAPCGDFYWMRRTNLDIDKYIGIDIVPELIIQNQEKYGNEYREFMIANITIDDLPQADIVLCRDCLVHLPFPDIISAIKNFKKSGSRYLLTTTFTDVNINIRNKDTIIGGWRPINLELYPFNLPKPIKVIRETRGNIRGVPYDKSLGLWKLEDILTFDKKK